MKLMIKSKLGQDFVYDENHRNIGILKKTFFQGRKTIVCDAAGNILYFVKKDQANIEISGREKLYITGNILYDEDQSKKSLTAGFLRPLRAESLSFHTQWGNITILQNLHRDFTVSLNGESIGEMTRMTSRQKTFDIHSQKLPEEFYCVLFVLGIYMFHDDDITIV